MLTTPPFSPRLALLAASLLLAACAVKPPPQHVAPAHVLTVDNPAPAVTEPVFAIGRTPAAASLATADGEATYYHSALDGRATASGVIFHNSLLYAAHRDFPFGTILRVVNLRNGHHVIVEVVDRGPHGTSERARNTIIDVSRSAAVILDFVQQGRAPVRLEVLSWGDG
jgi:rare lipoprotein A